MVRPLLRWRLGLRWTLLLALLPLLTLPWVGLRFVERMAELARDERLENQAAAARALAASMHERRELFVAGAQAGIDPQAASHPASEPLPVETLSIDPADAPDLSAWLAVPRRLIPVQVFNNAPGDTLSVAISAARGQQAPERMSLLVDVEDERFLAPRLDGVQERPGDEVIVEAGPAPNALIRMPARITENPGGWSAQVDFPKEPAYLRVRVIDVDYQGSRRIEAQADSGLLRPAPPQATDEHLRAPWADTVRALERVSGRVSVYDASGNLRAQRGSLSAVVPPKHDWQGRIAQAILAAAIRFQPDAVVERSDDPTGRSQLTPLARALAGAPAQQSQRAGIQGGMPAWILTSASPIWIGDQIVGALMLEENTAARLMPGQAALERLTLLAAVAVAASVLALLAVASITVGRVVRLRNEAEAAIDPRGRVIANIQDSALADELGDLRSSYARVLSRLREYQAYLDNLRSRLVHELRTPIMVVRSSLENLSDERDPHQQAAYIQRVQAGAARLERILASMGEASSLETMLGDSEFEDIDLQRLLRACADGYRSAFAPWAFELHVEGSHANCRGVPEAIAQAMDKLVSNAIDFATVGTPIVIMLSAEERGIQDHFWRIAVRNQGPALPRNMGDSLFDQLVSVRGDRKSEQSHLGLGLYLVRLIAEFHGGEAWAVDVPGGVEAGFSVRAAGPAQAVVGRG